MFAMLQMHGICMDTSLTEPEILSARSFSEKKEQLLRRLLLSIIFLCLAF